jgi:hypothetical protein
LTIEELIKNMTDEEKERFFEGLRKELEFWGYITQTEEKDECSM